MAAPMAELTSQMIFCAFHAGKWHLGHHGHHHPIFRGKDVVELR